MEFTTLTAAIILANLADKPMTTAKQITPICYTAASSSKDSKTRLVCNFTSNQIDDKSKQYIQDYMKENKIEEIYSIEATWTEGIE